MLYHIDKTLSAQHEMLVIRLEGKQEDQEILDLLRKEKCMNHCVYIPHKKTGKFLKLLAPSGNLFFNKKNIVCDFFSRNTFSFYVTDNEIRGQIQTRNDLFDLEECPFICGGPSLIFIHGMTLKFLSTDLTWKLFKQTYYQNPSPTLKQAKDQVVETDEDSPTIIYASNFSSLIKSKPLPILKLTNRTGAFANLWMDFGSGNVQPSTDTDEEKEWESDLLETDFIKKKVDLSHYFCPLDKVGHTLSFLLELGWKILDYKGREVVGDGKLQLSTITDPIHVTIKGKITFDKGEAPLSSLISAYQKENTFVSLDTNTVGLISKDPHIINLAKEGELVTEGIRLRVNKIGAYSDLLQSVDQLDKPLQNLLKSFKAPQSVVLSDQFHGQLRPYQQMGLNWLTFLYKQGFHGILADEMGLGKTVQVLAFLSQIKLALIIVPTSLIFNWKNEIEKFLPGSQVYQHYGPDREDTLPKNGFIITSYGTLLRDLPLFEAQLFQCLILDEAQWIKNRRTQVFQAVCKLHANFRLSITGTPIENRLDELFVQFHFLIPNLLDKEDLNAVADPHLIKRIKKKVRPFILRRTKEQVAKDLPKKIEQNLWIEMDPEQRLGYDTFLLSAQNNLIKKVQIDGTSKHRMELLETILRLRQICCHPLLVNSVEATKSAKLEVLLNDMETIQSEGKKALIFSQFTSMLSLISQRVQEKGWNFCYLDGKTKNRGKIVDIFQNEPSISFFIISLKAGGVGLNLTEADYVLLFDPWWNPAIENQAINRAHRIGRKDTVIAKRYLMRDSIEEKMMQINAKKQKIVSDILDENFENTQLSKEDFLYLLN